MPLKEDMAWVIGLDIEMRYLHEHAAIRIVAFGLPHLLTAHGSVFDSTCIYRVLHTRAETQAWIVGVFSA